MKKKRDWKLFENVWISTTPVLPGVWQRKEGGHVVRARAKESTTGKLREIFKVLPDATPAEALTWLEKERSRTREGVVSRESPQTRFSEFAETLVDHKVKVGDIKSAKGRERWGYTLEHLVAGTEGEKAKKRVNGFGDFFVDRIREEHIETWKAGIGELIAAGDYAPATANGWLAILRVIMKAAKRRFAIPFLATEDVKDFDTSEHATYTEEEPNALTPEEVPAFLAMMRKLYPQHYAMTFLGLVTGLRPSTLRPLRRRGPEADVVWEKARLLVRRSQTVGDEVMRTTKTGKRYGIDLPEEAMRVLRWHVETQLATPEMEDSDLLFPSVTGRFRSPSVLNGPFADVVETLGLGKAFTQRGMRRTFQDLARAADMAAIVTRSISGHATERMQDHYSTVNAGEQRASIAKVISLFAQATETEPASSGGEQAASSVGSKSGQVGSMVGSSPKRWGA